MNEKTRIKSCPEIEEERINETTMGRPLQMNAAVEDGGEQRLGKVANHKDNNILSDKSLRLAQGEATTSGKEKAGEEAELVACLNRELDKALFNQGLADEERLAHLHYALKKCMLQINNIQNKRGMTKGQDVESHNLYSTNNYGQGIKGSEEEANRKIRTTITIEKGSLGKALILEQEEDSIIEIEQWEKLHCTEIEKFKYQQQPSLFVQRKETQSHRSNYYSRRSSYITPVIPGDPYDQNSQMMFKSPQGDKTTPSRQINLLVDQLCEEENKALRDVIASKDEELRSTKLKCAHIASRLAVVESQLNGKITRQLGASYNISSFQGDQLSITVTNNGVKNVESKSQDTAPLLTNLEGLQKINVNNERGGHRKAFGGKSRMSLVNHFVKETLDEAQEKLAMMGKLDKKNIRASSEEEEVGKEIVRVLQQGWVGIDKSIGDYGDSPWNALQMIVEKHEDSKKSVRELLDDVISASALSCPKTTDLTTWASKYNDITDLANADILSVDGPADSQKGNFSSSKSISTIIQQEECTTSCPSFLVQSKNQTHNKVDNVHVFRWKHFELMEILKDFVSACSHLLSGCQYDVAESFALHLKIMLELTLEKCIIALQNSSHLEEMKYRRGSFGLDGYNTKTVLDIATSQSGDEKVVLSQMIQIRSTLQEMNKLWRLSHKVENGMASANQELERKLHSVEEENDTLTNQLQESKQTIDRLRREVEELMESQHLIKDQIETLRTINEDLDTQLTVARSQLNETLQLIPRLEVELEDKSNSYRELEAVCLELQLQLEIVSEERSLNYEDDYFGENLTTGLKMKVAPDKLSQHKKTSTGVESSQEYRCSFDFYNKQRK